MTELRLKIAVRHYPEEAHYNVGDITVTPLVELLLDEPSRLSTGAADPGDRITVTVRRTHEWEYVLDIAIAGGAVFGTAVLQTLGKRLGNWIADQVQKRFGARTEAVKLRLDGEMVEVDPDDPAAARDASSALMRKAAERRGILHVLFPW